MDSKTRLRKLAEAATIRIESNIPIRRYFRSGNEILKMAKVYDDEGNMEAAYVLYLKYVSLFLEGIKEHKDYVMVLPAEKKKTNQTLKLVLAISEEMKNKLRKRFDEDYKVWLVEEEQKNRRLEQERQRQLEEHTKREAEAKERAALIEKDRQLALWTQAQIDKGLDPDQPPPSSPVSTSSSQVPSLLPNSQSRSLPPPSYDELLADYPNSGSIASAPYRDDPPSYPSVDTLADFTNNLRSHLPDLHTDNVPAGSYQPTPSFDRSVKPIPSGSGSTPAHSNVPFVPDRSSKPVFGHDLGNRPVIVPTKLISRFLELARPNSDRDIETLGMLGGKLSKNKFTVTHLLIPKQTGKSDRCDLQGHEDLGEAYDSEDIILVGWIHTHPAYDVFLSSVDMHNQYEYQNMLNEFVAIVCSIKFNETGYLTLTETGMEDIGKCTQENFHPHSKNPPLFGPAQHVITDDSLNIKVMDLR